MNVRQANKNMKKQIKQLKSDKDLMRRIIADYPDMQRLYDLYKQPLNITHTTMQFQQFKMQRMIPDYAPADYGVIAGLLKREIVEALVDVIKDNINYEIDTKYGMKTITGSIFIGRK